MSVGPVRQLSKACVRLPAMDVAMKWMLVVHIVGFAMWVGTQIGASHVLKAHAKAGGSAGSMFSDLEKSFGVPMDMGATMTIVAGVLMIVLPAGGTAILKGGGFFHAKLLLVAVLVLTHIVLRRRLGQARRGEPTPPPSWVFPAVQVAAWAIVILIIVRPF